LRFAPVIWPFYGFVDCVGSSQPEMTRRAGGERLEVRTAGLTSCRDRRSIVFGVAR
jgi:hypothetical protein